MNFFPSLSDTVKGNLLILAGIILLLNALGITLQVIGYLTLIVSIFMIVYGFIQAGYYAKIMELITKKHDTHA